jgi:tetratricopeptide (TPR) repeat protein
MKTMTKALVFLLIAAWLLYGCSPSERAVIQKPGENQELSLDHYLQGTMLDQKGDYAKAILEYQDALKYKEDPAIYHSIAKDYAYLNKYETAIQMAREAVRMDPSNRVYHETLGEIYVNVRDLDNAIKQYQEITRIDSSYEGGWLSLARLQQLRYPKEALKTYEMFINRFGPEADALFQMAQVYISLGQLDKAMGAFKEMLELDPGNFEIKKSIGDIYLQQDSTDAALLIYNDLAERQPDNLELRAAIAQAYLLRQDYDHAADQFEMVMKKDTLSADDQIRFGQVFVSFLQKDSAVAPYAMKLFEKIRQAHPSDWRPYWFLGAIDNIMKNDSSAYIHFQKVRELAQWNPDGWIGVASYYYDKNQFDEAIKVLTEAKKFVPEESRVYLLLGVAYQRKHDDIDAASALEKAVQLNDKSVDALSALGMVYDEMDHHADSDSIYERALKLDPKNHLVLNNYAYSLSERGIQLDRALRMSKDALSQQPENQSYLDTYGWIYYKKGEYKEAEKWVRKAVELGSTSAVVIEHLGDIYFRMADRDKAMSYWKKALENDPANQSLKTKIDRGSL